MPRYLVAGLAVTLASLSATARADTSTQQRAAAQALFDEARRLVEQGQAADACPKFRESQSLDPGIGTLYNLGDCLEKTGRTAGAWAAFREAADMARIAFQPEREQAARRRAVALEPRLMRLRIELPDAARVGGLEVRRDGFPVGQGQWGMQVPVDPGQHTVRVTAPGKVPREVRIELREEGATVTVRIEPLLDAPAPPVIPASAVQSPGPGSLAKRSIVPPAPGDASSEDTSSLWGYALGAAALVGLGASTVLALDAKSKYDDSLAYCEASNENRCSPQGVSLRDEARSRGNYATVAFGLGAAALTVGAVLVLTSKDEEPATQARIETGPVVGEGGGIWTMRGVW